MSAGTSMDEIEVRAAAWILKRDRGECEEDRGALEAWLAQDARHRAAFLALDEAWNLTAGLKQWHPRDGRVNPDLLAPMAPVRNKRAARIALAASIAILAAVLGAVYLSRSGAERYSTPVGGYERIALDDGSVLQLNTDTAAEVRFTASRREIRLLRGEAFFEVGRDPVRPFEVIVGKNVARAVGTAFSVRVDAGAQMEVMVTQGRVMLMPEGDAAQPLLVAGESARAGARQVAVTAVAGAEIDRRLAWQRGQLMFDKRPLAEVAAEFNRYNRLQVRIATPSLATLQLTGNFKATDLASFVAAVKSAANARVEQTSDAVVISSP